MVVDRRVLVLVLAKIDVWGGATGNDGAVWRNEPSALIRLDHMKALAPHAGVRSRPIVPTSPPPPTRR